MLIYFKSPQTFQNLNASPLNIINFLFILIIKTFLRTIVLLLNSKFHDFCDETLEVFSMLSICFLKCPKFYRNVVKFNFLLGDAIDVCCGSLHFHIYGLKCGE